MKSRTVVLLACSLIAICLCHGCGRGEHGGLERFTEQYLRVMQEYGAAMERADSAQAVAAAIDRRENGLRKLFPERQRMMEKYPEFFDGMVDPPADIARAENNMREAARLAHHAEIVYMRYSNEPEVKEAVARMFKEWDR